MFLRESAFGVYKCDFFNELISTGPFLMTIGAKKSIFITKNCMFFESFYGKTIHLTQKCNKIKPF
jgi:hypothetical protein